MTKRSITIMETLLGSTLLTNIESPAKKTNELLRDKDLVALYFSAAWCPPCKTFSPLLAEFYKACAKDDVDGGVSSNTQLEIVYISSDHSISDFKSYYGTMPWLAIPTDTGTAAIKNQLSQTLRITAIPTLVVIDAKTGEFISGNAREEVLKVGNDDVKRKKLINTWKTTKRVPLSKANLAAGKAGILMRIATFFYRNPLLISFFLVSFIQWRFTYLKSLKTTDDLEDESSYIPLVEVLPMDAEF